MAAIMLLKTTYVVYAYYNVIPQYGRISGTFSVEGNLLLLRDSIITHAPCKFTVSLDPEIHVESIEIDILRK